MINTAWFEFFKAFFNDHSKSIGTVMYASGCREGWLQGEFFRTSTDENFAVNYYKLKRYAERVDLYGEMPTNSKKQKMVAEIKIIAPSFSTKNIDGHSNLGGYLNQDHVITNNDLDQVNPKEGSLLKDLKRLKSIADSEIEKYIILVIPNYEESKINKDLEKVLYSIRLSEHQELLTFSQDHFDVRIWLIDPLIPH